MDIVHLQMTVMLPPNLSSIIEQLSYRALYLFSLTWFFCVFFYRKAPKSKRPAERTGGENEGEEVAAQSARGNVGHKRGRTNQDHVRGSRAAKQATNSARRGRAGKRATDSAPRDEGGRNPKRAKKVADEVVFL